MFLPGGGGGNRLKSLLASSMLLGTCTSGFLAPVGSFDRLDSTDSGMPPPLIEEVLLLLIGTGGGSSIESGVRGESCGASCGAKVSRMTSRDQLGLNHGRFPAVFDDFPAVFGDFTAVFGDFSAVFRPGNGLAVPLGR